MNEMELNERLIARWISDEAVALGLFDRDVDSYVFYGDKHDFKIEIKAFRMSKTVRLSED